MNTKLEPSQVPQYSERPELKDLFSHQSSEYAKFRPSYPNHLFQYLSSLVDEHKLAWDCGTGNGQAAIGLADTFEKVIATDRSEKQLSRAPHHIKVEYRVSAAEKTTFSDKSIDMITVAQALHWFRLGEFFEESRRVLKPRGVLAFWCYGLCKITPDIDAAVLHFYKDVLGPYWEKERQLVEEGYKNVQMPLQAIVPPAFEMKAEWSLEHFIGYLGTWSAVQTYRERNHKNPLEMIYTHLKPLWDDTKVRPIRWELALKVGRA